MRHDGKHLIKEQQQCYLFQWKSTVQLEVTELGKAKVLLWPNLHMNGRLLHAGGM